jgi:hypothetical protein
MDHETYTTSRAAAVYKRWSSNFRSKINYWMADRIYVPDVIGDPGNRGGSQHSKADLVALGILHRLLAAGVALAAFNAPPPLRPRPGETRDAFIERLARRKTPTAAVFMFLEHDLTVTPFSVLGDLVGRERVIQKYLEFRNFDALVLAHRHTFESAHEEGWVIYFAPSALFDRVARLAGADDPRGSWDTAAPQPQPRKRLSGAEGYYLLDTLALRDFVEKRLQETG